MKIKTMLIPFYQHLITLISKNKLNLSIEKNNAIMFLSPDYGNIGDLAIEYAQREFLADNLHGYNIVSVSISDTYKYLRYIKKTLKAGDLLFIVGGGNLGDLYPRADFDRLFIANYLKHYPICSFPQTIVFTDTNYGQKRFAATKKCFSKNKNLTLFARENVSYEAMKAYFNNDIYLSPDIVLYLFSRYQNRVNLPRNQVTVTLRNDGEKYISSNKENQLISFINNNFSNVEFVDTALKDSVFNKLNKDDYIKNIIDVYSKSRFVITDRLHGMIFAAITGTPCIVLPNSNHKIKATYNDWLSNCNYITLIEDVDIDKIKETLDIYCDSNFENNYSKIKIKFTELEKYIKEISK